MRSARVCVLLSCVMLSISAVGATDRVVLGEYFTNLY
jgi:hypothetical protein